jgi:two-component system LytT family response regulator
MRDHMQFKTMIIDDENLARKRLRLLLQSHADAIEIVGEAANGKDGVLAVHSLHPDLIFLDIQMPGLTGFEMLQQLEYVPLVIFTTAYDEYALKAFETNAIDYLMKPISPSRLKKALDKLHHIAGNRIARDAELQAFVKEMNREENDYISVKTGSCTNLIHHRDIYFVQSEDKYSVLHTRERRYILSESLNELEKILPSQFRRIHRSVIINIDHVSEIKNLSGSRCVAVMKDSKKTLLPVSRRMRKAVVTAGSTR